MPGIGVETPIIDYGRCFIRYPYEKMVVLKNETDLPAKYEFLPQVGKSLSFSTCQFLHIPLSQLCLINSFSFHYHQSFPFLTYLCPSSPFSPYIIPLRFILSYLFLLYSSCSVLFYLNFCYPVLSYPTVLSYSILSYLFLSYPTLFNGILLVQLCSLFCISIQSNSIQSEQIQSNSASSNAMVKVSFLPFPLQPY